MSRSKIKFQVTYEKYQNSGLWLPPLPLPSKFPLVQRDLVGGLRLEQMNLFTKLG